jgi:hypothetical protein
VAGADFGFPKSVLIRFVKGTNGIKSLLLVSKVGRFYRVRSIAIINPKQLILLVGRG